MKARFRFVFFTFIFLFFAIFLRLCYWQIVRAQELSDLGELQYGKKIKQIPKRGEIKTADGFPIASNRITYRIFANPKEVPQQAKEKIAKELAPLLFVEESTISAKLQLNRYWISLQTQVGNETKEKIEKLEFPGIGFEEQTTRFYPEASLAAKLIGFVGKNDAGDNTGYFGLEGYYDRQLSGKIGYAIQMHDALGRPILAKMNDRSAKVDGRSIVLHVDRTVQYILDEEMKTGIDKYGAQGGMGIIMDPKTGGILGMSAFPSFDPRTFYEYKSELYLNPIISLAYEPGSTFKPLVMAAAIEEGLVQADTPCPICSKAVEIGGFTIKTWNDEYTPNITMMNVIRDSDNTGMVYVGQRLGLERTLTYLEKYGIGHMTGIDLQGELAPVLREKQNWYPIDVATASFGQGISVTPIELLTAFASLANDGKRMEPHVVDKIETPEGDVISIAPKVLNNPLSVKTTRIMREILVNAVKKGEAKWAAPKGYRIAGKTGTAQIAIAGHYDPNKTIPSFIGFAPADDPRFVMLVIYDRPSTSIYGSETAAPTFFTIAKKLLTYYGIPPTE